jgi:hypothetical protein
MVISIHGINGCFIGVLISQSKQVLHSKGIVDPFKLCGLVFVRIETDAVRIYHSHRGESICSQSKEKSS